MYLFRIGAWQKAAAAVLSYTEKVLAKSPGGYWRLGESSGTVVNDEIGAHDGTYVGTPTLGTTGLINNDADTAVSFGSSQYVTVASGGELLGSEGSVEFWMTPTWSSGDSTDHTLFTCVLNGANQLKFQHWTNNTYFFGWVTGGTDYRLIINPSNAPINAGVKYHVVFTWNASTNTTTAYFNGLMVGEKTNGLVTTSLGTTQVLFAATDTLNGFNQGVSDEYAIYPTELSAADVLDNYIAGSRSAYDTAVLEDSPELYYRLNETSGTFIRDEQNNANGSYVNTPTFGVSGLVANDTDTATTFASTSHGVASRAFDGDTVITLECWIDHSSYATGGGNDYIISIPESAALLGASIRVNDNTLLADINTTTGSSVLTHDVSLVDGTEYHIVSTWDGATHRLYVNGVETGGGSGSVSGTLTAALGEVNIGNYDSSTTAFGFTGTVQKAAVFPSGLSAARVLAHYNDGI